MHSSDRSVDALVRVPEWRPSGGRQIDRWHAEGPFSGCSRPPFLPPSRPRKSEVALQQTELLSVGTVWADVAVLMDQEISRD